eukprot:gene1155-681_t
MEGGTPPSPLSWSCIPINRLSLSSLSLFFSALIFCVLNIHRSCRLWLRQKDATITSHDKYKVQQCIIVLYIVFNFLGLSLPVYRHTCELVIPLLGCGKTRNEASRLNDNSEQSYNETFSNNNNIFSPTSLRSPHVHQLQRRAINNIHLFRSNLFIYLFVLFEREQGTDYAWPPPALIAHTNFFLFTSDSPPYLSKDRLAAVLWQLVPLKLVLGSVASTRLDPTISWGAFYPTRSGILLHIKYHRSGDYNFSSIKEGISNIKSAVCARASRSLPSCILLFQSPILFPFTCALMSDIVASEAGADPNMHRTPPLCPAGGRDSLATAFASFAAPGNLFFRDRGAVPVDTPKGGTGGAPVSQQDPRGDANPKTPTALAYGGSPYRPSTGLFNQETGSPAPEPVEDLHGMPSSAEAVPVPMVQEGNGEARLDSVSDGPARGSEPAQALRYSAWVQFMALVQRTLRQKRRQAVSTFFETLIPVVFALVLLALCLGFQEATGPTNSLNDSRMMTGDLYKLVFCSEDAPDTRPIDGLYPCAQLKTLMSHALGPEEAAKGYLQSCSSLEETPTIPVKGLCIFAMKGALGIMGFNKTDDVDAIPASNLWRMWVSQYLSQIQGQAIGLQDLNMVIVTQWAAEVAFGNLSHEVSPLLQFVASVGIGTSSLPSIPTVINPNFNGAYQYNTADMYLASGLVYLQKCLYDYYIHNLEEKGHFKSTYTTSDKYPFVVTPNTLSTHRNRVVQQAGPMVSFVALVLSLVSPTAVALLYTDFVQFGMGGGFDWDSFSFVYLTPKPMAYIIFLSADRAVKEKESDSSSSVSSHYESGAEQISEETGGGSPGGEISPSQKGLTSALPSRGEGTSPSAVKNDLRLVWNCTTQDSILVQFKAMLQKKFRNALRDRRLLAFQIICPVVAACIAMLLQLIDVPTTSFVEYTMEMFKQKTIVPYGSDCLHLLGDARRWDLSAPPVLHAVKDTLYFEGMMNYLAETYYDHPQFRLSAYQCDNGPEVTHYPIIGDSNFYALVYNSSSTPAVVLTVMQFYQQVVTQGMMTAGISMGEAVGKPFSFSSSLLPKNKFSRSNSKSSHPLRTYYLEKIGRRMLRCCCPTLISGDDDVESELYQVAPSTEGGRVNAGHPVSHPRSFSGMGGISPIHGSSSPAGARHQHTRTMSRTFLSEPPPTSSCQTPSALRQQQQSQANTLMHHRGPSNVSYHSPSLRHQPYPSFGASATSLTSPATPPLGSSHHARLASFGTSRLSPHHSRGLTQSHFYSHRHEDMAVLPIPAVTGTHALQQERQHVAERRRCA